MTDPPAGHGTDHDSDVWLKAFAAAVVVAYVVAFAVFFSRVGRKDHDQFLVFLELQYWSTHLFGLARQWSPLLCGGLSIAADPQVPFLSPGMLLSFLLGPFYGLRVATLAWLLVGWLGAFAYAGLWRRDPVVRSLAASLFVGNGFFIMRLRNGHLDLVPMLSLPLVLWALHRREALARRLGGPLFGRAALVLLLGGLVALVIDGAPVNIIHWLFWIGLYVAVLTVVERRPGALALLVGAAAVAAFLDAGYLWPMLAGQQEFPRRTWDTFTSPVSLLWFLIVPGGGRLIPAPAGGHELTVWVGPVVLWLIARSGRGFVRSLPVELRRPLAVTAGISLLLGMGSLAAAGWPRLLSPFDLLRPLPGFRSIGVTGRFWGFLPLPLALAGAAGLAELVRSRPPHRLARVAVVIAIGLQVGFQAAALFDSFSASRVYRAAPVAFEGPVDYVLRGTEFQGALITPSRGVIDCYNNGDFTHPLMTPGRALIREVRRDGEAVDPLAFRAAFVSWSRLVIEPVAPLPAGRWQVVLNQAHHRFWGAPDGVQASANRSGNLQIDWPLGTPGRIQLEFEDRVSNTGSRVSLISWSALLIAMLLIAVAQRLRRPRAGVEA